MRRFRNILQFLCQLKVSSQVGVRVLNGMPRGMGWHEIRMLGDDTVVETVHPYSNGRLEVAGDCSVIDSFAILNGEAGIIGTIVRANSAMNNQSSAFSFAPAAWRLATPPSE